MRTAIEIPTRTETRTEIPISTAIRTALMMTMTEVAADDAGGAAEAEIKKSFCRQFII
jgi:hypothetical protein